MFIWFQFVVCTAAIVFAGSRLSRYGDVIAEKTGLGRTWVGVVLMASVTSLPELITGLSSVAIFALPDIAAGDVLGSCMFNLLILALIDLSGGSKPLSARAHEGQVLTASFGILLIGLAGISISAAAAIPRLGWISVASLITILVYLLAMRTVFLYEKRRVGEFFAEQEVGELYGETSKTKAYAMYGVNAAIIIAAATYLPHIGDEIARMTGLGNTFVGSVFIALSTSLPELVVSFSALRLGAVDMAYGNLFGSNLFNICILAVDDIFYTKGPLALDVSGGHVVSAMAAIVMTAIAIVGLTYRTSKKILFVGWDSLGILIVYAFTVIVLFSTS